MMDYHNDYIEKQYQCPSCIGENNNALIVPSRFNKKVLFVGCCLNREHDFECAASLYDVEDQNGYNGEKYDIRISLIEPEELFLFKKKKELEVFSQSLSKEINDEAEEIMRMV